MPLILDSATPESSPFSARLVAFPSAAREKDLFVLDLRGRNGSAGTRLSREDAARLRDHLDAFLAQHPEPVVEPVPVDDRPEIGTRVVVEDAAFIPEATGMSGVRIPAPGGVEQDGRIYVRLDGSWSSGDTPRHYLYADAWRVEEEPVVEGDVPGYVPGDVVEVSHSQPWGADLPEGETVEIREVVVTPEGTYAAAPFFYEVRDSRGREFYVPETGVEPLDEPLAEWERELLFPSVTPDETKGGTLPAYGARVVVTRAAAIIEKSLRDPRLGVRVPASEHDNTFAGGVEQDGRIVVRLDAPWSGERHYLYADEWIEVR